MRNWNQVCLLMKSAIVLISLSVGCWAQSPPAAAQAGSNSTQAGGFESEWDLKKQLEALVAGARRLKPIVDESNPQNWKQSAGANDYYPQWKTSVDEIQYLIGSAEGLAKQPERLTLALETYFRLETMDRSVGSLLEGIRKYHNSPVADQLRGVLTENANNRERLKQYITELASSKEKECKVMDEEAQRCRAMLNRQPASTAPPRGKPAKKEQQ